MVRRRHGQLVIRMLHQLQCTVGIAYELGDGRIVEALRPVEAKVRLLPLKPPEVVHHVSAGEDHHAPIPQRRKPSRQVQMIIQRPERVDR